MTTLVKEFYTTFLNGDEELRERGLKHLYNVRSDLHAMYNTYELTIQEVLDDCDISDELKEEVKEEMKESDLKPDDTIDILSIDDEIAEAYYEQRHEYGLSFDYCGLDPDGDDTDEDYFRYQFCWGGPSSELRIYADGTMVFAFLDWFVGVGFDVTGDDVFKAVADDYKGLGMLDWQTKREEDGYYDILWERENRDEEDD